MRRIEARVQESDYLALTAAAEVSGVGVAQFVRQALAEKIDRHLQLRDLTDIRDGLDALGAQLRHELIQARTELAEDHRQGLEAARAEVTECARKNEQLTRSFLMSLTDAINPTTSRTPSTRSEPWSSPLPTTR